MPRVITQDAHDLRLNDSTVLVIGAGGHLMSEAAMAIARAGAVVICADRDESAATLVATSIEDGGGQALSTECDVTSDESLYDLLGMIESRGYELTGLLNGAGINAPTPVFDIDRQEWHRILEVQLVGVFRACQIFGRAMVQRRRGSIVNVSSASAGPPLSKAFVYSAAKAAVVSITQNLAREWASSTVRVNAVRPGFFPTDWNLANFIDSAREEAILRQTPMGRFGHPSELTSAILWLLSDHSSFVTGAEIPIDGGFKAFSL